jgi:hypothetical protein
LQNSPLESSSVVVALIENYSTSKPLKVSPEKSQILSCDAAVANARYMKPESRWKDFSEVTTAASQKKSKATKCSDYHTISPIKHTTRPVARTLQRTERKIANYVEKISLDLAEKKELEMQLEC